MLRAWAILILLSLPIAAFAVTLTKNATVKGNVSVLGALSKGSGSFVIDHPLDPKNKLLYHSFVEAPDPVNIYDGIVTLSGSGEATVVLPDYFLALNKDFAYLLTPIGTSMPNLHIDKQVAPRFLGLGVPVFKISGGKPGGEVSWQVTGIRHDQYIIDHPYTVEVLKGLDAEVKAGEFICPECYGH